MKNKIENEPNNIFVQYLTEKQKSDNWEINFSQLIDEKLLKLRDKKSVKAFLELILSDQIELAKNKRFPYEYTVELASDNFTSKLTGILKCVELYNRYTKEISPCIRWNEFEKITGNTFSGFGICKEIKKLKLSPPEIKILFKTVSGFLMGQHPVFLNDMQLNPEELIDFSLLLSDEQNPLIEQDLIRLQIDQDGVSIRTTITKKTLSLIGNLTPNDKLKTTLAAKDSLFEIIKCADLEKVNLQYAAAMNTTFNDFCALSQKITKNENLSLLLHGASGTGKTEFAKQVTKNVNGTLFQLNFPQIQSKWIGETEKNIRRAFMAYEESWTKSKEPIILLINEADGLMNKRVSVNTSNDAFANQAQTELLEQLEKFNGILIATTNLLGNIDSAFHRRFLFKTEIQAPDVTGRTNFLKQSSIYNLLNPMQISTLNQSCFTIAELKNLEQKINLIQRIRNISTQDIDDLFMNESINRKRTEAIGYASN